MYPCKKGEAMAFTDTKVREKSGCLHDMAFSK